MQNPDPKTCGPTTEIILWKNVQIRTKTTLGEASAADLVDWALIDPIHRAMIVQQELGARLALLDYLSSEEADTRGHQLRYHYRRICGLKPIKADLRRKKLVEKEDEDGKNS